MQTHQTPALLVYLPALACDRCGGDVLPRPRGQAGHMVCNWCAERAEAIRVGNTKRIHLRRQFNAAEVALIRQAHAGQVGLRTVAAQLRTSNTAVYRVMDDLGLPRRRGDCRRKP